ncbi:MAG TPA: GNAT family N-acetyltransferase [Aggregatilineaceae bacterium]|nr:GNAT family N-acetyltransferase [Aggregatilineaceae bacterium]
MSKLTIRHATADDWPIVADLGAQIFARGEGYDNHYKAWMNNLSDPWFRWEQTYIGLIDGQIVSHVSYMDRVLRYGRQAEFRFGGISGVITRPEYRGRGYAAEVMKAALRGIEGEKYHLTLLDGIARYYDQFGYVTIWPTRTTKFTIKDLLRVEDDGAGYRVRAYHPDDLPALLALYEAEWGNRPCFIPRTAEWMESKVRLVSAEGNPYTYVVEDKMGNIQGYSCGWQIQERMEVIVTNLAATVALLRHTAQLLADQPDTAGWWLDLPNTNAATYAQQVCTMQFHTNAIQRGGWRGRFVDRKSALEILQSEYRDVVFEAQNDCIVIRAGKHELHVTESELLQLMFGETPYLYKTAERDILEHLFPPQVNGLAGLDWF